MKWIVQGTLYVLKEPMCLYISLTSLFAVGKQTKQTPRGDPWMGDQESPRDCGDLIPQGSAAHTV